MWKRASLGKDFLLYLLSISKHPVVPALLFMSRCEGALLVRSDVSPGKEIQGSGLTLINWSLNSREALSQALLGFLFLGPFGADVVGW